MIRSDQVKWVYSEDAPWILHLGCNIGLLPNISLPLRSPAIEPFFSQRSCIISFKEFALVIFKENSNSLVQTIRWEDIYGKSSCAHNLLLFDIPQSQCNKNTNMQIPLFFLLSPQDARLQSPEFDFLMRHARIVNTALAQNIANLSCHSSLEGHAGFQGL